MRFVAFVKQVAAVFVGFLLALFFLVFLFLVGLGKFVTPKGSHVPSEHAVLELRLQGRLTEIPPVSLTGSDREFIELRRLKQTVCAAAKDPRIQAIYLRLSHIQSGWPALQEIRAALLAFKAEGKKIVAYADVYSQKAYYLASVSDEIVLNPSGFLAFQGFSATVDFYTKLFEHVGIQPIVFRIGDFKSAVEPFCLTKMSPESRAQLQAYLNHAYDCFLTDVAAARSLSVAQLKALACHLSAVLPGDAREAKLISKVGYEQETKDGLKKLLQQTCGTSDPEFVPYRQYGGKRAPSGRDKIAVVVAEGDIVSGSTAFGVVGDKDFVKMVRKVQLDSSIKAVVLRINSPGGDVLASDNMWHALASLKAVKPVVASMSDMAASGGYYIATPCSYVFAQPTTLTGSIGIFALLFDPKQLMDKVGISRDVVKTAPSADFLTPRISCTEAEKTFLYRALRHHYDVFLTKVAQGRNLSPSRAAQLASGRIFSGTAAQQNGLVDALGGIDAAIEKAASLANVPENYGVVYFPLPKSKLEKWWEFLGTMLRTTPLQALLAHYFPLAPPCPATSSRVGVQAILPYRVSAE